MNEEYFGRHKMETMDEAPLRIKMLHLFYNLGGIADFQLEVLLKKNSNSCRPARIALEKKGYLKKTSQWIENPKTGGKYAVYKMTEEGTIALETDEYHP